MDKLDKKENKNVLIKKRERSITKKIYENYNKFHPIKNALYSSIKIVGVKKSKSPIKKYRSISLNKKNAKDSFNQNFKKYVFTENPFLNKKIKSEKKFKNCKNEKFLEKTEKKNKKNIFETFKKNTKNNLDENITLKNLANTLDMSIKKKENLMNSIDLLIEKKEKLKNLNKKYEIKTKKKYKLNKEISVIKKNIEDLKNRNFDLKN